MNIQLITAYERLKPCSPDRGTYRIARTIVVVRTSRRRIFVVPFGEHAVKLLETEQDFLQYYAHKYVAPSKKSDDDDEPE